eukprot:2447639-Rhodomonas_salina.2
MHSAGVGRQLCFLPGCTILFHPPAPASCTPQSTPDSSRSEVSDGHGVCVCVCVCVFAHARVSSARQGRELIRPSTLQSLRSVLLAGSSAESEPNSAKPIRGISPLIPISHSSSGFFFALQEVATPLLLSPPRFAPLVRAPSAKDNP